MQKKKNTNTNKTKVKSTKTAPKAKPSVDEPKGTSTAGFLDR